MYHKRNWPQQGVFGFCVAFIFCEDILQVLKVKFFIFFYFIFFFLPFTVFSNENVDGGVETFWGSICWRYLVEFCCLLFNSLCFNLDTSDVRNFVWSWIALHFALSLLDVAYLVKIDLFFSFIPFFVISDI